MAMYMAQVATSIKRHLAFLTYKNWQENAEILAQDCQIVKKLNHLGLQTTLQAWDVPFNPSDYSHAITKSTWNYHLYLPEFKNFLQQLDNQGVTLINPLDRLLFSMDKSYLFEIGQDFTILKTEFFQVAKGLPFYFEKWQTNALVFKPTVSAGAYRTYLLHRDGENQTTLRAIACSQEQFLVQPYYDEIKQGELSFIFFNGAFSHAVKKLPQDGDFRSQPEHGATLTLITPELGWLQVAQALVQKFAPGCFYARLDALVVENQLHLMELELVEPSLFLLAKDTLLDRYCQELLRYLKLTS